MNFQKKYTGQDILIIGGGTSTLDTQWENIVTPSTYIWTCNDFYMNDRVLDSKIDLYQLAYTTKLSDNDKLINKLKKDKPLTYYEPDHYRRKENSKEFKTFEKNIEAAIPGMHIDLGTIKDTPASKSGAVFRLILLASTTKARNIYFVGFDGFNKDFSNCHAFTGHRGLKKSDTRRDYDGNNPLSYVNIFTEAYRYLASLENKNILQNLGEGLDYNIGSRVSKKYFPLRDEIKNKLYETIR